MMISNEGVETRNWWNSTMSFWFWPVLVGAGGYSTMMSGIYAFQRSLMYVPYPLMTTPAKAGVPEMSELRLTTVDGLELVSWYVPAAKGQPTVVYCHGNTGNIASRAFKVRPFLDRGYGVILVGYRGYGSNPGSPTEEGLHMDAMAASQFLADQNIPANRILYYGESLGSGVAVRLAAEHRCPGAIVLEAPFTSTVDVAMGTYWFLPVKQMIKDRFESITRIDRVGAPLLVLHGENDGVVPVRLGRELFEAAAPPKEAAYFPAGGHIDLFENGAIPKIFDFLDRHMGAKP
ncbi:MAG: alpha/beta hydrolase [Alphaproteobacteria bacterium]|nr:alpha/beta hydrolase [Alphaproteobacteria bacterium]